MKRVVSVFLAILMSFTILVQPVMAEEPQKVNVESLVREQIEYYASSLNENSKTGGVVQLLKRFISGSGKDLIMDADDDVTSMLMNAEVTQRALTQVLTKFIETNETEMVFPHFVIEQPNGTRTLGTSYLSFYDNACCYRFGTESNRYYIGYTTVPDEVLNENDKSLILVAGQLRVNLTIDLVESNKDTLKYRMKVKFYDNFDFGNPENYDKFPQDSTLAKLLTTVGKFIALGWAEEFSWESHVELNITVPNIHPWPEFDWAEDYSSCDATLTTEEEVFSGECAVETQTIAASCTDEGKTIYTASVELNGRTYSDIKEEILPKTNHDYQSAVTAPTCTESGYTTHTCSVCGDSYTDAPVEANGHSYNSVVTVPTCTESGYTTHTCTVCGDSYTDTPVAVNGHSYNSVVTAPTCTETGYTTHTCTVCGDSYTDSAVEANGHSYNSVVTVPTCTESGYTTHTCTVCGDSYIDTPVIANGHTYVKGICVICGAEDESYYVLLGDVNGDGAVTNLDAMLALQYFVGLADESKVNVSAADVNNDGSITNLDAMLILQRFVGLITEFPAEK